MLHPSALIIGVYVRQCILEYKKVTFPQMMRFHSSLQKSFNGTNQNASENLNEQYKSDVTTRELRELDFASKLRDLVMLGGSMNEMTPSSSNIQVAPLRMGLGSEALRLAELHGKFGHNKEGMRALEEVIRLAQRNDNFLLLEHALAWLLKLESFEPKDHLVMLKKFVKNAADLNLPLLGVWGRLQQVKTLISMSESPKIVLQTLITSELDHLSSNDEDHLRHSLHTCGLALLATTWEHYGHRLLALHYAQLVCHMTSCDHFSRSPEEEEAVALSVVIIARHLQQTGHLDKSLLILSSSISLFGDKRRPFKIISKCYQELKFDRAIEIGDFSSARRHLKDIQSLDKGEGIFRSAVLARGEGRISDAVDIVMDATKRKDDLKLPHDLYSRCLQLLCDMNSDLGLPSQSLLHIVDCLSSDRKSLLPQFHAKLRLSHVMLQLGCSTESLDLLNEICLQVLSNGSLKERGKMYSLMAQANLLTQSQDNKTPLLKEGVLEVLPLVARAVTYLRECSDFQQLEDTLLLQAHLYDYIGYTTKRDETSRLILELHQNSQFS